MAWPCIVTVFLFFFLILKEASRQFVSESFILSCVESAILQAIYHIIELMCQLLCVCMTSNMFLHLHHGPWIVQSLIKIIQHTAVSQNNVSHPSIYYVLTLTLCRGLLIVNKQSAA